MERLPGFRDFYPEPLPPGEEWSADTRRYVFEQWRDVCRRYGFREYDGPPLEPLELFTTKSGGEIVGQLYNFIDKGERAVALRPEMTPTLARMVAAAERAYKKPIKWFAMPQLFRYERQQKGRLREHFQLNADIFGEADPGADAELIALLIDVLRSFGLTAADFMIRLSSRNAWQAFFASRCRDSAREYDFYQVIDKMERADEAHSAAELSKLGIPFQEVRAFVEEAKPTEELAHIIANLAARGLSEYVKVDYNVIRGLAYYTGPVFEAFDRGMEERAIAGGGRYNHLVKLISGGKIDLPGLGFGMGDVVLTQLLKKKGLLPKTDSAVKAFCLIEDESLRGASLSLIQELREQRFAVEYSLTPMKSDKQFKRALELNAAYTIRLERDESGDVQLRFKNLRSREEKLAAPGDAGSLLRGAS